MKLNNTPGSLGRRDSIARYELRADDDSVLEEESKTKPLKASEGNIIASIKRVICQGVGQVCSGRSKAAS